MWTFPFIYLFVFVHHTTGSFYDYRYGDGYVSDGEKDTSSWHGTLLSGRMSQPKCIDIPKNLSLCQNIGYDQMRIPNLLDHDSINEVIQQSKSWISLLGVGCHPDTQLFLCSLFSPVCLERDREIYPCRSLCERVRNGCEATMKIYGYNWPDMVRCDKFPEEPEMCIPGQNTVTAPSRYNKPQNFCNACNRVNTLEGLIHNYCRSNFVVKAKIQKSRIRNGNTIVYLKKKKKIIKGKFTKKEKRKLFPMIENGENCECDYLHSNSTNKKYIIMGNKTESGEHSLIFMAPWGRDRNFRKAVRLMSKGVPCDGGIIAISEKHSNKKGRGNKKKGKGRKKKNKGRRKNKGKKKKKGKKDDRKIKNNSAKP